MHNFVVLRDGHSTIPPNDSSNIELYVGERYYSPTLCRVEFRMRVDNLLSVFQYNMLKVDCTSAKQDSAGFGGRGHIVEP